jgi:uncharacterized protein YcbX
MIGVVAKLWRYPVKSMLGEECSNVEVTVRGVDGDRLFAVRDGDGKLGSGKNTRRFRQIDGLFAFRPHYTSGWPDIDFPNGGRMRGDDPRIHAALSDVLGVAVTLIREDRVSHFDSGAVHLLSTGALAWLRSRLPEIRVDERRFRPNIVVATTGDEPSENSWVDKILRIGNEVRLKVTARTERCRMTTLEQTDLAGDPRVLRCIAQEAGLHFGVYAEVLTSGRVSAGEAVTIERAA